MEDSPVQLIGGFLQLTEEEKAIKIPESPSLFWSAFLRFTVNWGTASNFVRAWVHQYPHIEPSFSDVFSSIMQIIRNTNPEMREIATRGLIELVKALDRIIGNTIEVFQDGNDIVEQNGPSLAMLIFCEINSWENGQPELWKSEVAMIAAYKALASVEDGHQFLYVDVLSMPFCELIPVIIQPTHTQIFDMLKVESSIDHETLRQTRQFLIENVQVNWGEVLLYILGLDNKDCLSCWFISAFVQLYHIDSSIFKPEHCEFIKNKNFEVLHVFELINDGSWTEEQVMTFWAPLVVFGYNESDLEDGWENVFDV